jgi:hypothetical protein
MFPTLVLSTLTKTVPPTRSSWTAKTEVSTRTVSDKSLRFHQYKTHTVSITLTKTT